MFDNPDDLIPDPIVPATSGAQTPRPVRFAPGTDPVGAPAESGSAPQLSAAPSAGSPVTPDLSSPPEPASLVSTAARPPANVTPHANATSESGRTLDRAFAGIAVALLVVTLVVIGISFLGGDGDATDSASTDQVLVAASPLASSLPGSAETVVATDLLTPRPTAAFEALAGVDPSTSGQAESAFETNSLIDTDQSGIAAESAPTTVPVDAAPAADSTSTSTSTSAAPGAAEAGSIDATSANATSGDTGGGETSGDDSHSGDTGSGDTGSGDTGSGDTGSGDTGSGDSGSGDTSSAPTSEQSTAEASDDADDADGNTSTGDTDTDTSTTSDSADGDNDDSAADDSDETNGASTVDTDSSDSNAASTSAGDSGTETAAAVDDADGETGATNNFGFSIGQLPETASVTSDATSDAVTSDAGASTSLVAGPSPDEIAAAKSTALAFINDLRSSAGAAPVSIDPTLNARSQQWSDTMAATQNFVHCPFDNGTPKNCPQAPLSDACVNQAWAENIGYGTFHDLVLSELAQSPGHYSNMVDTRHSQVGIGVAYAQGSWWVTHTFGTCS